MPINTYVALDTKTISTATPTVVFTSIPQTYTDLILVSNTRNASGLDGGLTLQFNTDTSPSGTNYSTNFMYADGSNPYSSRHTNYPHVVCNRSNSSNWSSGIAHIMDYKNTTTNKSIVSRGSSNSIVIAYGGVWRATPQAITTITVGNEASVNFVVGSTFTLYGVANSNIGAPKAFGGTITQDANYTYHTFGASGTFTPQQSLTVDALTIAGGGGGGKAGGGGGAGSVIYNTGMSLTTTGYSITIGGGGAGATSRGSNGSNGVASTFNGTSATGGGGGASNSVNNGSAGGSGGGGVNNGGTGGAANAGTLNGGTGYVNVGGTSNSSLAAGGGGAGQAGQTQISPVGGLGGNGLTIFSSWGLATGIGEYAEGSFYITGGGSGYSDTVARGGYGGGGASGVGTNNGSNGLTNTGGGGGGSRDAGGGNGGGGGAGVVIIRYAK